LPDSAGLWQGSCIGIQQEILGLKDFRPNFEVSPDPISQVQGNELKMFKRGARGLRLGVIVAGLCFAPAVWAAHVNPHALSASKPKSSKLSETQRTRRRMRHLASSRGTSAVRRTTSLSTTSHSPGTSSYSAGTSSNTGSLMRASAGASRHRYHERFFMSSFAEGITGGDLTDGEDPVVRQAAIDALGNMNGTVVAIEPTSGRVLAMVNQKLALSSGAQPCSTIKLSVALAALNEGLVSKQTQVSLGGRSRMNLTEALAHSNNAYFEAVGSKLGFEKVAYYAHQYGLGELAGYDIPGEQLGTYPDEAIPAKLGGVGKMCKE